MSFFRKASTSKTETAAEGHGSRQDRRSRHNDAVVSRRQGRALVGATMLVTVLGVAAAVTAGANKTVALDVDGNTYEVSTFSSDIEGLLTDEGIELAEHDLVVPEPQESLRHGAEVVVRSAQEVGFQIDGSYETLWTTSLSADEALTHLTAGGRDATLTASRSSDGRVELAMPLTQGGPVTILVDDEERTVEARGPMDLEGVLRLAEISLNPADRVSLGVDDAGAALLTINRVEAGESTRTETVEHDSVERDTSDLYAGESRVVQEGQDGERTYTVAEVLVDGEVESTKRVGSELTTEPQDRIVEVGTAPRPAPQPTSSGSSGGSSGGSSSDSGSSSSGSSSSGSSDSSSSSSGSSSSGSSGNSGGSVPDGVWGQLAQCESGGNPSIVSANGLYHGLYQFRVDTWQSVGGSGLPSEASPAEQTERAKILQQRSGWGQWPACARSLGLL